MSELEFELILNSTHKCNNFGSEEDELTVVYKSPHSTKKGGVMMKKNMGIVDRTLRAVLALVVAVLYVMGVIPMTAAIILGIIAGIFIITSLIGFCPLYVPLKISTRKQ